MLRIKNLQKSYGKYHVLDGLDMEVREGAIFGFVGPNGAGKTTTIKIIVGLLRPDGGKVIVAGVDATMDADKLKEMIGYVPDFFGVYDNLRVCEYMEFFASCYGIDGFMARKRCSALLEQVGLEEKANFYVDSLSRGIKQRLCLARALIHDPRILVMDEPASGLDPRTRYEFKEIVRELQEQGKTIFISSHVLSDMAELCTDIGVIEQGKMALCGNMKDILSKVNTSNPIVISVFGDGVEKAVSLLKSHPCVQTISVRDHEIMVGFIGDRQDEAMLLQQLVDADILIIGYTRMQGSLESLFMQITNHEEERTVLRHENQSGL